MGSILVLSAVVFFCLCFLVFFVGAAERAALRACGGYVFHFLLERRRMFVSVAVEDGTGAGLRLI